ncbi:MAG: hypothetical protein P4L40_01775 [Terracidiphilus sp.]|nr:hypothetical protein [Terracidiphilus sp.]
MIVDSAVARQDAADLHRFIEQLVRMCADRRDDYPVFTNSSIAFFSHISKLGVETQRYLERFPDYYSKSADLRAANSKRVKLVSLKNAWEELHAYIRPALDADSLHLPMPLITAFQDEVRKVEEWEGYQFVLFHTTEVNYLQIPSDMARSVANRIADRVGGERFDPNLGLVGIPYSQSNSFFLNCLLPHEFAHFIYQENTNHAIEEQIDESLDDATQALGLDEEDMSFCLKMLKSWIEETFCDLLAICIIGPAFSLALMQLTAATLLVGRPDGEPADNYFFKEDYPANVARFHFHQKMLKKLGWWEVLSDWKCTSVQVLTKCEEWSPFLTIEGPLPDGISQEQLLGCYQEVSEWMLGYCAAKFPNVSETVKHFRIQSPLISEYLVRAIVPSTVVNEGAWVHPDPVVLMNAGYRFFLEELVELIKRIEGENPDSVETHSRVAGRLELWVLKAIEDSRLLARQVP